MSNLSWDDSTKKWTLSGFSSQNDLSDYEAEDYDYWGFAIKKRLVGNSTWLNYIDLDASHQPYENFTTTSLPSGAWPVSGYEYQGYRVHVLSLGGGVVNHDYFEPSNIYTATAGPSTLDISINPITALFEATVLATVVDVGGVTTHAISGVADSLGETTVSLSVISGGTPTLTGTVRVNGSITPNIRIIAVKTDGSKVFSAISNTNGTFSVSVEQGNYQVIGVYTDGSGNKYSSLITPYVVV